MNPQEMRLAVLRLLTGTAICPPVDMLLRDAERMTRFVETGQAEAPADAGQPQGNFPEHLDAMILAIIRSAQPKAQ